MGTLRAQEMSMSIKTLLFARLEEGAGGGALVRLPGGGSRKGLMLSRNLTRKVDVENGTGVALPIIL